MRLKEWAAQQGIHYQTAWKWFRDGKLPVPALQTPSGTILVQSDADARPPNDGGLGLYARVSSHDQRADLAPPGHRPPPGGAPRAGAGPPLAVPTGERWGRTHGYASQAERLAKQRRLQHLQAKLVAVGARISD